MRQIRAVTIADLPRLAELEAVCFPATEAAKPEQFSARFAVFPECFLLLEEDGKIVGHINGCVHSAPELPDALYANPELHRPDGDYQTVFGLVVDPDYRGRGFAGLLLERFAQDSRERGCKGMVLTCKAHLVGLYERHGFVCQGVSASSHGGAQWMDMLRTFQGHL
ncbi:MAG: GNAT family N-acetyltransferase [Pseudomonadales bacterium]